MRRILANGWRVSRAFAVGSCTPGWRSRPWPLLTARVLPSMKHRFQDLTHVSTEGFPVFTFHPPAQPRPGGQGRRPAREPEQPRQDPAAWHAHLHRVDRLAGGLGRTQARDRQPVATGAELPFRPVSSTSPWRGAVRRWHPGPAPVAIDRSGPRSRISTSAVTVKVAKRSASGPDTAGASGPGLAPPPGAARSILQVRRAAYRPRTATAAADCDQRPR
jgi:hypothetical protein